MLIVNIENWYENEEMENALISIYTYYDDVPIQINWRNILETDGRLATSSESTSQSTFLTTDAGLPKHNSHVNTAKQIKNFLSLTPK